MINKIDNNQPLIGASSNLPNDRKSLQNKDLDVTVNDDFSLLVDKAMKSTQTDAEIIKQARESMLSGELESPENFIKAAGNIITFGI